MGKDKDFVLLAWVKDEDGDVTWMHATASSDMGAVGQCTAIKLISNELIDTTTLDVAYPSNASRGKSKAKRRGGANSVRGEAVGTSRKKEKPAKRKGGFQRVSTDSPPPEGDSVTDEEEALCADIPAGNGKTRG